MKEAGEKNQGTLPPYHFLPHASFFFFVFIVIFPSFVGCGGGGNWRGRPRTTTKGGLKLGSFDRLCLSFFLSLSLSRDAGRETRAFSGLLSNVPIWDMFVTLYIRLSLLLKLVPCGLLISSFSFRDSFTTYLS